MACSNAAVISLEVECRYCAFFRVLQECDGFGLRVIFSIRCLPVIELGFEEVQDGVVAHNVLLAHIVDEVAHCLATVILIRLFTLVLGCFCDVFETLFVIFAVPSLLVVHFLVFHTYLFSIDCSY